METTLATTDQLRATYDVTPATIHAWRRKSWIVGKRMPGLRGYLYDRRLVAQSLLELQD